MKINKVNIKKEMNSLAYLQLNAIKELLLIKVLQKTKLKIILSAEARKE